MVYSQSEGINDGRRASMSKRIVEPSNIKRIFDRPGRDWTFEERNIVWEWLETQKSRIESHVRSSLFCVKSEDEVDDVSQGFYADRLDDTIKSYDPSRGRRFWNWFVYCFVQYCHDLGIKGERRRYLEGQLLSQLTDNDEDERSSGELLIDRGSHSTEEVAVFEVQVEEIKRILVSLPERDQKLISLRFEEDMTYPEIAADMNKPVGSVKGWIFRALHQIRRELVGLEGGNEL
jgi:RNA polymerase sigma factor (sigma-70 family)